MAKANRGSVRFGRDEAGVSEIVGALLLVVVVSSAAFGFGLFIQQQAKATEAQKAAEQARLLEKVAIDAALPSADPFDPSCDAVGTDDAWHAISLTVTSLHLKDTTVGTLRVNQLTVRHATVPTPSRTVASVTTTVGTTATSAGLFVLEDVGRYIDIAGAGLPGKTYIAIFVSEGEVTLSAPATTVVTDPATLGDTIYDFSLLPGEPGQRDLVLPARRTTTILLENVAMDEDLCDPGTIAPYAFFGSAPGTGGAGPVKTSDAIQVELGTELTNSFQRAFVPPNAIIQLDVLGGASTSYVLDASGSESATEGGFLVQWRWSVSCSVSDPDCSGINDPWTASGRLAQADIIGNDEVNDPGTAYDITLLVKDNFGMTGTATFTFTL